MNNIELDNSMNLSSENFTLDLSYDEAKILFDALSSHRFKMLRKKDNVTPEYQQNLQATEEKLAFLKNRIMAIENEIDKSNIIFQKLGKIVQQQLQG